MDQLAYDDFEILRTLGVGTVGTIYHVKHRQTEKHYALKLLLESVSRDPLIVRRFAREMLVLSKLNDPNIVSYHGNGKHEGKLFYVMELIEGGTLKSVLRHGGSLSWQETAECGRQIASALQHAHNHGIIHRDLKPGNVFLTDQARIKFGDFGIARDIHEADLTDTGLTVGTYAYMAPELVRGQRATTGQIDLYALGCLLFEMLCGRPPYQGDNFAAIFDQHLHATPPQVRQYGADCPPALERLIVQLLAKSPEDRPFNARTVQGMLGELIRRPDRPDVGPHAPDDRAAADVRPIQLSLIRRIQYSQRGRDVSWVTLSLFGIALSLVIGLMIWLSNT